MKAIEKMFKDQADSIIDKFQDHINLMPDKGDTTETSQKIVLQQSLNELSYAVNGTEANDLEED